MNLRRIIAAILILTLGASLTACSTAVAPDEVGLYYMKGSTDGYKFGHCMEPGAADDYEWDNEVIFLPASLRIWNISAEPGADSNTPITVSAAPEAGQPSGVQVNVWPHTGLMLNTNCKVLQTFWEKIGRRYAANTDEGWKNMMRATVVTALLPALKTHTRTYGADALVANTEDIRTKLQSAVAAMFTTELKRLTGGDFFCGPSFIRGNDACPPVEITITDIDYSDGGIQDARNQKQKAVEQAAAAVAAAQGQLDAAKKLGELYSNKAWMELEKAKIQLQIAEKCAQSQKCQMVMSGGDVSVHTSQ